MTLPLYDPQKSYLENMQEGPCFSGKILPRATSQTMNFLGFPIRSPIGVPAGPLLSAQWVDLAGKLGFDVPTYKTIRSQAHPSHPVPNIVFVERQSGGAKKIEKPRSLEEISITNSFGMPSMSPEFLMEDIPRANAALGSDQVMIVSVVGTKRPGESFLSDFVKTAQLAKSAGAKIIEANFSCPNVDKEAGSLYSSAETVYEFAKTIAEKIHPVPLLIKGGLFENAEHLRSVLLALARSGAAGLCGLNSVSMEVAGEEGIPALGSTRQTSGVCGSAIRLDALRFMESAASIKRQEKLDLVLLGCGGLITATHLQQMLEAGADLALSATGMMWDPFLAFKFQEQYANTHR